MPRRTASSPWRSQAGHPAPSARSTPSRSCTGTQWRLHRPGRPNDHRQRPSLAAISRTAVRPTASPSPSKPMMLYVMVTNPQSPRSAVPLLAVQPEAGNVAIPSGVAPVGNIMAPPRRLRSTPRRPPTVTQAQAGRSRIRQQNSCGGTGWRSTPMAALTIRQQTPRGEVMVTPRTGGHRRPRQRQPVASPSSSPWRAAPPRR